MKIEELANAVRTAAAIRSRTRLQPAGGDGDKVFPPTYLDAKYAREKRLDPETKKSVRCVLLDSVQSQANRLEEALQAAIDRGDLQLPLIVVDFADAKVLDPIGQITSLQAPHRMADAILRDSLYDGTPFRESEIGTRIDQVSPSNATPLLDICPTALLFGMWDSTGPKGGLGAKFARAMVSEIVGYGARIGVRTASRIDPLEIRAAAKVVKKKDGSWEPATDAKAKGAIAPSEINHGNIPPVIDRGGVTIRYALQTTVISLAGLRRLRFPVDGKVKPEFDDAGRTLLAALGLCSAALAAESGFDLRSRCLLWPTEPMKWELLAAPGSKPLEFSLKADQALAIFRSAVNAATKVGLPWRTEPIVLKPSPSFIKLVQRSQELAATGSDAEG